ncbi:MAG: DUF2007 domain-containing protein [Myxococcota bacterium]
MDNLVELTVCQSHAELIGVRSLLESEGIDVAVVGDQHAGTGGMLAAPNPLRVMVGAGDLDLARELLEELDYAEHLPAEPSSSQDEGGRSMEYFRARSDGDAGVDGEPIDRAGGLLRERRRAPLCLFVVAGFFIILGVQTLSHADIRRTPAPGPETGFIVFAILAAVHAALGVWSYRAPLRAAYSGVALFAVLLGLIVAADASALLSPLIVIYVPIGLLLWRAVVSGRRVREAQEASASP